MNPLAIALSGAGRELVGEGGEGEDNLTKVQSKLIQNYHNESFIQRIYSKKNEEKIASLIF
jgi:hypothetical protein